MTSKPAPPKPAGPGPKPSGPTHPSPSGPPHGNGHELPDLPPLAEVVLSARILAEQLINALGRDFDPRTASSAEAFAGEPLVHVKLAMLRSDVLQVRRGLTEVGRLAVGNAADRVMFQDRPGPDARVRGLPPGPAAGSPPARESTDAPQAVRAGANVTAPPT
jgi:hypothetical protein